MKVQIFLLVCVLANFASSVTITGVPNIICGQQTVNISAALSSAVTVNIVPSVPSVGIIPSSLSLTPAIPSATINITCNAITPVQISFLDSTTLVSYGTFNAFCKGVMYIQNPISSVIRGSEFSLDLFLFPTPQSIVEVLVKINNPIIVPGSDILNFGVGQNSESEIFYVPAGPVGNVEIAFDSRSLRDYSGPNCQELVTSIDVLGTITTDLQDFTLGEGIQTNITVQIHPPATSTVVVTINSTSLGVASPSSLVYTFGQDTATFSLLPEVLDPLVPGQITFSAQYYDTLVEYIYVIGTIFSSISPVITSTAAQDFYLVLLPGAQNSSITVYVTASSNIIVPSTIVFAPGVSLVHFSLQATSDGPAFVTFSANGYVTLTNSINVAYLTCPSGQTANINSALCVNCPAINGNVCSGNGVCAASTVTQYAARCVCNSGYAGAYCELSSVLDSDVFAFTYNGVYLYDNQIPGVLDAVFYIPPGIIPSSSSLAGGNGYAFVRGYYSSSPFPFAVSPSTFVAPTGYSATALVPGFGIDIVYSDNTIYNILNYPVSVVFYFDPTYISQTDFLEMSLYYYNITSATWVPAEQTCSTYEQVIVEDLIALALETNLCALGQYQFFALTPNAINAPLTQQVYTYNNYQDIPPYQFPTTGVTGFQAPVPPQPKLTPVLVFDPSPPRMVDYVNSSVSLLPSFLLIAFVLSLLF